MVTRATLRALVLVVAPLAATPAWDPGRRAWSPTVDVHFEATVQVIRCP